MLSCNCLNVIIESETNNFVKVTLDLLKLSEEESKDVFFKQVNLLKLKLCKYFIHVKCKILNSLRI